LAGFLKLALACLKAADGLLLGFHIPQAIAQTF